MLLRRPRTDWFFLLHAATRPAGFQDIRVYGRDGISDARLVWKAPSSTSEQPGHLRRNSTDQQQTRKPTQR